MTTTAFDGRVSTGKEEWLTPPELIHSLGEFDLDPCAPINRPWPTASRHLTILDDGLNAQWNGRVWLNPPYGNKTFQWMKRMAEHEGGGIALIFARTETRTFFETVWPVAHSIMFLRGRIRFYNADGTQGRYSGGAPSSLIAYSTFDADKLAESGLTGKLIKLK